jgi:hypothetical protein
VKIEVKLRPYISILEARKMGAYFAKGSKSFDAAAATRSVVVNQLNVERQRLIREQGIKAGHVRAAAIRRGYSNPLTHGYY